MDAKRSNPIEPVDTTPGTSQNSDGSGRSPTTQGRNKRRKRGKQSVKLNENLNTNAQLPSEDPLIGLETIQPNLLRASSYDSLNAPAHYERMEYSDCFGGSSDSDDLITKKRKEDWDVTYRDYGSPDDDEEIEAQFDRQHSRSQAGLERGDLMFELTQEKARRMAQAVRVPDDAKMGEGEKGLYLELALRGCKPVMFHHWKNDFSTLPESLFCPSDASPSEEKKLTLNIRTRSDFHAIKAMKDVLDLGGQVRDCSILPVHPPNVISKAIVRYLRWAIDDAGLEITRKTIPAHILYAQKRGETTLDTVTSLVKKLTTLAMRHRNLHDDLTGTCWPTLVGYVICGPIATIMSLDSNPDSPAWSGPSDSRVKYMGQFDFTEPDQDVWNSLALALSVIHIRETMLKIASVYMGPRAPSFRSQNSGAIDHDH